MATKRKTPTAKAIAVLTALLPVSASVLATPDDEVTVRAQIAVNASALPDAANIAVSSFNGEIELNGIVRSEHSRTEAARIVSTVPGVTAVRNDLNVQPIGGERDQDQATARRVRAALVLGMPRVTGISIAIFNGAVELTGAVENDEIRAMAAKVAGETRGVASVRNDLTLQPH